MMRTRAWRGVVVAGALAAATIVVQAQANLTGGWQVDQQQSTFKTTPLKNPDPDAPPSPPPPPADKVFAMMPPQTLTQKGNTLTIQEGAPDNVLTLTTDGRENVNKLPNGRVNTSTSRWKGNVLITNWKLELGGRMLMEGVDERSLAPGGAKLIDKRTVRTPFAETVYQIIWTKK